MSVDRKRGCLIGLAVGDALGAAVEFKSPSSFELVTGYRAGGPHGLDPGEWTDDTRKRIGRMGGGFYREVRLTLCFKSFVE